MAKKTENAVESKSEAPSAKKEIKGIVRIAGRDIKGETKLRMALVRVKGIGVTLSSALTKIISNQLNIPKNTMIGELSDEQVDILMGIIGNPNKYGIPERMLNRQKDPETNQSAHIIGTDLTFRTKQDITNLKDLNTWKGYRHAYGQKVRGQRTRTTGRTGMTVGVLRKTMLAKAAAAKAAEATTEVKAEKPAAKVEEKVEKKE
ncbi:MAG: 30S ribosomal protein S13 [Candidatus Micrarchaeota archaeon]|nr:30S ribosomal protein S13 [Candidatus Micrarchaeota archaeon]